MAAKKKTTKQSMMRDFDQSVSRSASPEGTETEEDLQVLDPTLLGKAVVFGTDWTAGTLLDQLRRRNIDLDPIFQRRDAWTPTRKSRLIESIVLGLPIPQLVLAESKKKGTFLVIDGKQRLLSLRSFGVIGEAEDHPALELTGLRIRKELNGKTYADLQNDARLSNHLTAFENQPIRTIVIKNWQREEVLYLIFHRLNSETLPLSTQELRQALIPGPFLRFAADYTESFGGLHKVLGIGGPDFRMRDVELLVRYLAFQYLLNEYSGNLKAFLDDTCKNLNKHWSNQEAAVEKQANEMEEAIQATLDIFGDDAFQKWDGKIQGFQGRFNRAVFDVMIYYFSQESVRKKALKLRRRVKLSFVRLCTTNSSFVKSIETTTKSKKATEIRFNTWKKHLGKTLGMSIADSGLSGTLK